MGGNAIKSVAPTRLPRQEYLQLEQDITSFLRPFYACVHVYPYFANKLTFGDLDVIVSSPLFNNASENNNFLPCGLPSEQFLSQPPISTKEYLRTSATSCSFEYRAFQVDITIVQSEEVLNSSMVLMSYSGLGMLFGACIKRLRVKWSPDGLFMEAPEKMEEGKEWEGPVKLSGEVTKILDVFGLDYRSWERGFETEEDLWKWCAKSWVFQWTCVKDALKKILEKPMKREIAHRGWMYLYQQCSDNTIEGDIQAWHNELVMRFAVQSDIDQLIAEKQRYISFRSKFNGKLVSEWTGLNGKELGQFLVAFQEKNAISKETFMKFVEQHDSLKPHILNFLSTYHREQQ